MKTYRYRRPVLYALLGCVVLFGSMAVMSIWFFATVAPSPDFPQTAAWVLAAVADACFIGMLTLSLWGVVEFLKSRLDVGNDHVQFQGVVSCVRFSIGDVAEARWRESPQGGSLKLRDANRRKLFTLEFWNFEQADRIELIRSFRSRLPLKVQHNWAWFCLRCIPRKQDPDREPAANEVLLTRRRYDTYGSISLALAVIAATVSWWIAGEVRVWIMPAAILGFWLLLRFNTPKSGTIEQRIQCRLDAVDLRLLGFVAACFVGMILLAGNSHRLGEPVFVSAAVLVGLVTISVMCWLTWRIENNRRTMNQLEAERIAAEYDREWGICEMDTVQQK